MGWFSPIKGGYPSLGQIDKTLPVATGAGNTKIQRGMIIAITEGAGDGEFAIPATVTDANEGLLYIALQDYDDAQAGMAGTTSFDGGSLAGKVGDNFPANMLVTAGTPSITGLALSMEGEYETDQYDPETLAGKKAGTALTVANGLFKAAAPGDKVVAYLTGPVDYRWINNAPVKPSTSASKHTVTRQGRNVSVIRFRTK